MIMFSQVRNAADGTTWKTADMRGYMCKTNGSDGAFTLTFKRADGIEFKFAVTSAGVVSKASPFVVEPTGYSGTAPTYLDFDAEFMKLAMSTWSQVDPEAAAAVLSPGDRKW